METRRSNKPPDLSETLIEPCIADGSVDTLPSAFRFQPVLLRKTLGGSPSYGGSRVTRRIRSTRWARVDSALPRMLPTRIPAYGIIRFDEDLEGELRWRKSRER